jgi:hypothetical protein
MKTLNETFEDAEYEYLEKIKRQLGLSWHDFIIALYSVSSRQDLKVYAYNKREKEAHNVKKIE